MVSRNKRLNIVQDVTKWALVAEAKESTCHLIFKLKKKRKTKERRKTSLPQEMCNWILPYSVVSFINKLQSFRRNFTTLIVQILWSAQMAGAGMINDEQNRKKMMCT